MAMFTQQVKHDRINLRRLVRRLENVVSEEHWTERDHPNGKLAWVNAQSLAQKVKYARKLLLDVEYYQELNSQTSAPTSSQQQFLQNVRDTLDRLDKVVDGITQRLPPEPEAPTAYLSLVPMPAAVEEPHDSKPQMAESSLTTGFIPSDTPISQGHSQAAPPPVGLAQNLLSAPPAVSSSDPIRTSSFSQPQGTSSLLSTSFQTHEELSNELSRMATQLKRNAQHFSEFLDKDKALVLSASEALEKNYDAMSRERVRLKTYTGSSSGTTWMIIGALVAVSVAWVLMFLVIRIT